MSTPSRRKSSGKAKGARASTTTPSAAAGDDGRDGLQLFSSATVATAASATVPPASHVADSHAAPLGDAAEAAGGGDAQAAAEAVGKVLGEVGELAVQATQHVRSRRRIQPTARGVSFLELKNQLLLQYNANLVLVMLRKLEGTAPAAAGDVVERLVYLRTVLERIQPLDRKLKYQIDKLVKMAATGTIRDEADLLYKPDPANLVPKDAGEEAQDPSTAVYRPPKISATTYEESESKVAQREKREQREQRRLASSRLLRELHSEISDRPEEIQEADADGSRYLRSAKVVDQESAERIRYEEENFKRLPTVKTKKRRTTRNVVDDVLDFSGFERLVQTSDVLSAARPQSMRERVAAAGATQPRSKSQLRPSKRVKVHREAPDEEAA